MGQNENPSRHRILQRIREAVAMPALASSQQPDHPIGEIFPPVTDGLERLKKECTANTTECVPTAGSAASAITIRNILASLPPGPIFVQDAPALRQMSKEWQNASLCWSTQGPPQETSQATITLAHVLVAETGSIFVSAGCGGRGASVVAPVHIVAANTSQLVPTLEAAFTRLHDHHLEDTNSYLCLITGSSRTADIEKMLVLGAHGPRRLVLVLAQDRD
jgi:L-lactate dehydrogenase complex protein LldG